VKSYLSIPVGLLFLLAVAAASDRQAFLAIQPSHSVIVSGAAAVIEAKLTNVSHSSINILDHGGDCDFVASVWRDDGRTVSQTEYGKQHASCGQKVIISGKQSIVLLQPGESLQKSIDISRLYDMKLPAKYFIRVTRQLLAKTGTHTAKSNTISIIVTK
jgi:hypothetical protein